MSKEVKYRNIRVEQKLVDDIKNLGLTTGKSGEEMKAFHFIAILMDKSHRKMGKLCDYHPISTAYFIKVFGNRYFRFLNPLRDNNIVQVKYVASKDAGRCHLYSLNPKYFKNTSETVNIKIRYKVDEEKDLDKRHREALADFKTFYEMLVIDEKKMLQELYYKVDSIDKEIYKINHNIDAATNTKIKYSDGYRTRYGYVHNLIKKSYTTDKSLIQDGREFYFINIDDYKELKKHYITSSWMAAIQDLKEGNLRVSIDEKGKREHTNLTNLPKELRRVVFEDSGIENPDIKNSQFAFYSMILNQKGVDNLDAKVFINACQNGRIYELIEDELKLSSRDEAKQTMFLINFSSDHFYSPLKELFKRKFPTVAQDISEYKQKYGSEAFPLLLQRTEAEYILEKVRPKLKEMNIITASIHDSICCKEEDSAVVLETMQEIAEEIGLKAIIDLEYKKAA